VRRYRWWRRLCGGRWHHVRSADGTDWGWRRQNLSAYEERLGRIVVATEVYDGFKFSPRECAAPVAFEQHAGTYFYPGRFDEEQTPHGDGTGTLA
jgi:hypothetical protein